MLLLSGQYVCPAISSPTGSNNFRQKDVFNSAIFVFCGIETDVTSNSIREINDHGD